MQCIPASLIRNTAGWQLVTDDETLGSCHRQKVLVNSEHVIATERKSEHLKKVPTVLKWWLYLVCGKSQLSKL